MKKSIFISAMAALVAFCGCNSEPKSAPKNEGVEALERSFNANLKTLEEQYNTRMPSFSCEPKSGAICRSAGLQTETFDTGAIEFSTNWVYPQDKTVSIKDYLAAMPEVFSNGLKISDIKLENSPADEALRQLEAVGAGELVKLLKQPLSLQLSFTMNKTAKTIDILAALNFDAEHGLKLQFARADISWLLDGILAAPECEFNPYSSQDLSNLARDEKCSNLKQLPFDRVLESVPAQIDFDAKLVKLPSALAAGMYMFLDAQLASELAKFVENGQLKISALLKPLPGELNNLKMLQKVTINGKDLSASVIKTLGTLLGLDDEDEN